MEKATTSKKIPDPIGSGLKKRSPDETTEKTTISAETEPESWTPLSDNRIELAVAKALWPDRIRDGTPISSNNNLIELIINSVSDAESFHVVAEEEEVSDAETIETSCEIQQTTTVTSLAVGAELSSGTGNANITKATNASAVTTLSNGKQFIWNPNAPEFVPRHLANHRNNGSRNHNSTLFI